MGGARRELPRTDEDAQPAPRCLVGTSATMMQLCGRIAALSRRRCTVLIQGETGTGKELVARQIHAASDLADGPFVPVDCTTLSDGLAESQLFGHTRGSFTGAHQSTLGFMRAADGGTLFLDEIAEMPLAIQVKLLRCIEERAVVPLGAVKPIGVDFRILVATHRDLAAMVQEHTFREDLYYRLNVAYLPVPPLRQRKEDIEALAQFELAKFARLYHESPKQLSRAALEVLCRHDWPGNVRELSNAVEHAVVFAARRTLEPSDLPASVRGRAAVAGRCDELVDMETSERRLIEQALKTTRGNQTRAAELLSVERHWLHRRIVRYNLQDLTHHRTH